MTSSTQKNGPASLAGDPSRGSDPAKEIKNMERDSTAASARQEKHQRIIGGIYEIEGDMNDLVNMVRIMADLLDSELREHSSDTNYITVKIGHQHWDMVNFAFNDCVVRANAFRAKFNEAIEGRMSQ